MSHSGGSRESTVGTESATLAARRDAGSWTTTLAAVIEVGKLNIYDLWLGIPLAWSLLDPAEATEPRTWWILALALVLKAGTSSAALALDDVAGLRDGVDTANHGDTDRYAVNKPLLDGRLSEREALVFAVCAASAAVVALALVAWVARPVPLWLLLVEAVILVGALNYSFWLKLSYRGGGELITVTAVASTLFVPYALVSGTWSFTVLLESLLLGLWMLQVAVFSNTQDRSGDLEAGRLTVAALTSERGNYVFICSVFAASAAVLVSGWITHHLPLALAVTLLPSLLLQARQIYLGVIRERWLEARLLGFKAFRLGVAGLLVVNLFVL